MKFVTFALTVFLASVALAGPRTVGNGGDALALEFKAAAFKAIQNLRAGVVTIPVSLDTLATTTLDAQVIVVDQPLQVSFGTLVQNSTAENFQSGNLIKLNRAAWMQIQSPAVREGLALHEILSLVGLESTANYTYSQTYVAQFSSQSLAQIANATDAKTPCTTPVKDAGDLFQLLNDPKATVQALQDFLATHAVASDALNQQCRTPSMQALFNQREDFFALLDRGEDVNEVPTAGVPPAYQRSVYFYAVAKTSWPLIQKLKARGGTFKPLIQKKLLPAGETELHVAAQANSADVVQRYIASGVSVDALNARKQTPLMMAASGNSAEVVTVLLRAGANVHAVSLDANWTPIFFAAGYKAPAAVVEALVRAGADVNAVDGEGETPLTWTAMHDYTETARALIAAGANVSYRNKDDATALGKAVFQNSLDMVNLLLESGASANETVSHGSPILLVAAACGNADVVQALLAAGAPITARTKGQVAALHASTEAPTTDAAKVLLQAGADVNAKDEHGLTPLAYAASTSKDPASFIRLFVSAGAKVNLTDLNGATALFQVGVHGEENAVEAYEALLGAGEQINAADKHGQTVLMYAAKDYSYATIDYLIHTARADVNQKNSAGFTAYDVAVAVKRPRAILQLLGGPQRESAVVLRKVAPPAKKRVHSPRIAHSPSLRSPGNPLPPGDNDPSGCDCGDHGAYFRPPNPRTGNPGDPMPPY